MSEEPLPTIDSPENEPSGVAELETEGPLEASAQSVMDEAASEAARESAAEAVVEAPVSQPRVPKPPPAPFVPRRTTYAYRVTCLTPTLVGDGYQLSPIDYMVWRDQVNVLDQTRIFKLLAKGPRLEGYLTQLKKASKLDFASWGGFAQNYAGRRIAFEHASSARYWERAQSEFLSIPTFAASNDGPVLPGAALKGALRSGLLFGAIRENTIKGLAERMFSDRPVRHPGDLLEDQLLGASGSDRMRMFGVSDSAPVAYGPFKVYLLRTSTLTSRGADSYSLAWKQSPRGSVSKPEDSTPTFAEMADRGSVFEGRWNEKAYLDHPDIRRVLRWDKRLTREALFAAANRYAAAQLALHRQYAAWTGLNLVADQVAELETMLHEAESRKGCLLSIGWGGGFAGKSASPDTSAAEYRKILGAQAFYSRAIQSGLPFPKTRRLVFLGDKPASLPGWVLLEVG